MKHSVLALVKSTTQFSSSPKSVLRIWSRSASSTSSKYKIKEERISRNMLLRRLDHGSRDDKPLVLMFDWLFAKPGALAKYCNLYHGKGMDVIVINGKLRHFLWPPTGFKLVDDVLDYIMKERSGREKLLVHAFSIGAYIYTLMMIHASSVEKYRQFKTNVVGQVFDSIVIGNYDNMSTGIASTFTRNKAVKSSTLCIMNAYYNMTRKHTRDKYDEFVHYFIHNPIQVPTLVLYALNDPMSDPQAVENMISTWRNKFSSFDVKEKCWEKSVHAAHIKFHEQEYVENWEEFMRKIVS